MPGTKQTHRAFDRQRRIMPQPPSTTRGRQPSDKVAQYVPTAPRHLPRPGRRPSPIESLHRLRLLVAEAVRYQKKHNSTALHRFVRQRLGFEDGIAVEGVGQELTPGLPAELVRILLTDLELVTQQDGAEQAFLQLIELPLWILEAKR
jgi:hypothetical protein